MTNDAVSSVPAGWYPDPTGRHEQRYWDGRSWTDHAVAGGAQIVDVLVPGVSPTASNTAAGANSAPGEAAQPQSRRELRDSQEAAAPLRVTSTAVPPARTVPTQAVRDGASEAPLPAVLPQVAAELKVPVFGARKFAEDLIQENARLVDLINRHGLLSVQEAEQTRHRIEAEVERARQAAAAATRELSEARAARDSVAAEILDLRAVTSVQEFGLYDYENPAELSVELATELEALRQQIKQTVSRGHATRATHNFTFNNSAAQGRKFVGDMSKLMLRSYNAEAENCVKTVRAGNLHTAQKRLSTAASQVERLGGMIDLHISDDYHRLRLKELELTNRHLQAVQHEKELERARREELREAKKAEQELAREKERLEKERSHYANALAALEAKGDFEGAERLRDKLADVERAIDDVDYRAANIRAGYVYVISNIGSFGPEVVKIGLTRRLDPMDRVNELGDASVPFRFDVHALFFADDAVGVESMLHQHFAEQRINRVNLRREYFRVTPEQVLEVLRQHSVEVLEFTLEPAAEEYRSSITAQ